MTLAAVVASQKNQKAGSERSPYSRVKPWVSMVETARGRVTVSWEMKLFRTAPAHWSICINCV